MILPSLPIECFINIFFFLDRKSLYKCLFVSRFYCKLSIPRIWKNPFRPNCTLKSSSIINTLLACLNEDEISYLIPCAINFNNQSPLFEYGRFVRKFDQSYFVDYIITWLESTNEPVDENYDCRIQKLIDVIYHTIMRQGSNLQELKLNYYFPIISHMNHFFPKALIFKTYKPGITNLRSIHINLNSDVQHQKAVEILNMLPKFCNGIVDLNLRVVSIIDVQPFLDIIKSQPLEKMVIRSYNGTKENINKIVCALEFRSETLKELVFWSLNFQEVDLSSISRLECLEWLKFRQCEGFTYCHYEALSKKRLCFKELEFHTMSSNVIEALFNSLHSEALLKLTLSDITPKIAKAIKESCPRIGSLDITISSRSVQLLDSIIPLICELSSLKFLCISISDEHADILESWVIV